MKVLIDKSIEGNEMKYIFWRSSNALEGVENEDAGRYGVTDDDMYNNYT